MPRILITTAVLAFALDQITKVYVLNVLALPAHGVVDVWPPFLRFVMAWNRGVNFGIFSSGADVMRWVLVVVSVAITVGIFIWARRRSDKWFLIGAGLVVGGALGNALDRVLYGAVADFLNTSCCGFVNPYSFNVADVAIFGGAALLILRSGDDRGDDRGGDGDSGEHG